MNDGLRFKDPGRYLSVTKIMRSWILVNTGLDGFTGLWCTILHKSIQYTSRKFTFFVFMHVDRRPISYALKIYTFPVNNWFVKIDGSLGWFIYAKFNTEYIKIYAMKSFVVINKIEINKTQEWRRQSPAMYWEFLLLKIHNHSCSENELVNANLNVSKVVEF